jgi:hypothetical protein
VVQPRLALRAHTARRGSRTEHVRDLEVHACTLACLKHTPIGIAAPEPFRGFLERLLRQRSVYQMVHYRISTVGPK